MSSLDADFLHTAYQSLPSCATHNQTRQPCPERKVSSPRQPIGSHALCYVTYTATFDWATGKHYPQGQPIHKLASRPHGLTEQNGRHRSHSGFHRSPVRAHTKSFSQAYSSAVTISGVNNLFNICRESAKFCSVYSGRTCMR